MTLVKDTNIPYALITGKTPDWLKSAPPTTHALIKQVMSTRKLMLEQACQAQPAIAKALATEHARLQAAMAQVQALYDSLPSLEAFASEQLKKAIQQTFGVEVDINNNYLLDVRQLDNQPGQDVETYKHAPRSLLESALRNFEAEAAKPGGMDNDNALLKKSVILDHKGFMGTVPISNTLDIAPERFARMCRELDIGGQYQAKLQDIYYSDIKTGASNPATFEKIAELEGCTFTQSLHLARLQNDISQSLYVAALALPLDVPAQTSTLTFSVISLWDVQLTRIRLFDFRPTDGEHSVALYIPGDPETPIREFASLTESEQWLRDRLLSDIMYLEHCMKERDKAHLQAKLLDRLMPLALTVKGTYERTADPQAKLRLQTHPLSGSLLQGLVTEKVFRHEEDAAFHAIPTTLIDTITAVNYREHLLQKALTTLNIAGFFIPAVGEVMLGICALQLAYEVYEGIESWAHDDQQQAYQYMLDVVKNVAEMAAFTLAIKAVGGGLGAAADGSREPTPLPEPMPVETPSFIEELEEVELPDGQARLWRADLRPYAQSIDIPDTLPPDSQGLRHHQGRTWLKLDGQVYSIVRSAQTDRYHIEHPTRANAYQPALRHNGADTWLHPLDRPEQWQEVELLRRSGVRNGALDEVTARRILRVSNIEEDVLRQVLCENQRLPGQLQDTLVRFDLYHKIEQASPMAEPGSVHTDFQQQYRSLPASQSPGAKMIYTRYPQLPTPVTEELLQHATAHEQDELSNGKIPRRLADEVRLLQQQIRLNRAFEGLYLDQLRNWDTDLLILHIVEQLPGWPAGTSITLEQRIYSPSQSATIGPEDGPSTLIISARAGYMLLNREGPDVLLNPHGSLHGALFEFLSETQRAALGIKDEKALKSLVQQAPMLSRPTLRKLLGMQDVSPDFRSPMRLANGRIGYPLGGTRPRATSISRQSLLGRIRQIGLHVPTVQPAEPILAMLESRSLDRPAIDGILNNLLEQRNQLQTSLSAWRQRVALRAEPLTYDLEQVLSNLSQHWYDLAFTTPSAPVGPLRLERLSLIDFPLDLPAFFTSGVTQLQLSETLPDTFEGENQHTTQLRNLFAQFTNLRSLEVSRDYLPDRQPSAFQFSLPLISEQLQSLESLSFVNQNIQLSSTDINSLSRLRNLHRLDLSGNQLSRQFPPSFNSFTLHYLGLDNMELNYWPNGINHNAITQIHSISLRNNNFRTLPRFLINESINLADHAHLSLLGNNLHESDILRILMDENGLQSRFEMDLSVAVRAQLSSLLAQRREVHNFIDNYLAPTMITPSVRNNRLHFADSLRAFWRNQEVGMTTVPLRFEGVALGHFPGGLPTFLTQRVQYLSLEQISGESAELGELLSAFPHVTRLTIDSYNGAQPSFPAELIRLPNLTELALRNVDLEINQNVFATLGQLHNVRILDLTHNRFGSISTMPHGLQSLRQVHLNQSQLTQWPRWLESLPNLDSIDLSNNQISELPEFIFSATLPAGDTSITAVSLFENSLTQAMLTRIRTPFRDGQRYIVFVEGDPLNEEEDLGYYHADDPEPNSELPAPSIDGWLVASEAENEALADTWHTLYEAGDARYLLALIERLKESPTYRNASARVELSQRVRKVLVRALLRENEREKYNLRATAALPLADGDQTCCDGALVTFKDIEDLIADNELTFDGEDTEANRYLELRRLYRVARVKRIAAEEAGDRDAAEVQLAYRMRLNGPLSLGEPTDNMRYHVNISIDELTDAEIQTQRGELGEDFLRFSATNERWRNYLREAHPQQFAEIERDYQKGVNNLDMASDGYDEALQALKLNKNARESHLIRELTEFADPDRRPRTSSA